MDYKREIEDRINNIRWNIFSVKKEKKVFLEDIEAIAKDNKINSLDVIKSIEAVYFQVVEFLKLYNSKRSLPQEGFCFAVIDRSNELQKEINSFFLSSYFVKNSGGEMTDYFYEIRHKRHSFDLSQLISNLDSLVYSLNGLIKKGISEYGQVEYFDELSKEILVKLNIVLQALQVVVSLKGDGLKLFEIRNKQLIARNKVHVEVVKGVMSQAGELNVLCVGGIISLEELKKQNPDYYKAYSFLNSVEAGLVDDETPLGKYATLFYRIENGHYLLNRLEEAENGFKFYRKEKEIGIINGLRSKISASEKIGYVIQVEVIKEKKGLGYSTALVDISNWEVFEQEGARISYTIVKSDNPDGEKMISVFEKAGFVFLRDISQIDYEWRPGTPDFSKPHFSLGIRFKEKAESMEFEKLLQKVEDFLSGKKN